MTKTILVIEDNEQNMYLMRFLLEKESYQVLEAADGQQGIDLARRFRPDGILLDIQLPRMNGYQVTAELRADPNLKSTPIIVVTSFAMPGDREVALSNGATDYLEKPIDPTGLMERVRQHVPL
jgi:CheY-like chemotaxis protein